MKTENDAATLISPEQLIRDFDRIRGISNELEKDLELARLCHIVSSQYSIDAETVSRLFRQHSKEMSIPAFARPLLRASRRIGIAQDALKNIALVSIISSAISFFMAQSESRTLFVQKQWELAETGPKIGSTRKSAIEILASRGFNLGRLQAQNSFLAHLRLPERAGLQEAGFSSSNLYGSSLINANLYFARFSTFPNGSITNLENVNFSGSDLREANFKGAYMKKTCLRGTNLEKAKFDGAILTGADFRGSRFLTVDQIRKAKNGKSGLYDRGIAKAIGAQILLTSAPKPASCRLPAMQRNLFNLLLGKFS